ncbi:MAG: hypothetical protein ACD_8C00029G0004 [uncultured bacterium]|nr:MAG: hypothetical protein ACD_8C00029G0004 [uncultured bacterium]
MITSFIYFYSSTKARINRVRIIGVGRNAIRKSGDGTSSNTVYLVS